MNPNQQDNASPASDRDAAPPAPHANAEVGSKLKDAQVKLLDAQEALAASNAAPKPSTPPRKTESAKPDSAPTQTAPSFREAKVHAPSQPVTEHLSDNVAAMLSYLLGWVSGLLFLFIDRRPFVRFHAAQSVAVFATLNILILALGDFFLGAVLPHAGSVLYVLRHLLELAWLVAAVVLMLRAAGVERFRVKMASEYADRAAHGRR